ncbi:MAG: Flp pilus assembly protein CpaB, partial [Pirellulaceae bacterium]|nr:Flp pilus assembly protein CpaB [Pirellulaceae bacterium]
MSRISPGTVIVGIFAVLFGLVGAYAVRKSLQRPEQQAEAPQLNVVPVASIDLIPGRTLSVGDIAIMRLTAEQIRERGLPEGYMTNSQQIIGRTLREPLKQGQPFMTTDLYPEGMGPSVAERLKPGLRAVTVPIANTAAVAGMATPGSFVDVLFRTDSSFGGEELAQTTITLLESVEVLAFGQNILPGTRPPNRPQAQDTVTLAVSPEQAAALKVVEDRGDLMLTLRSPADLEYISDPQPLTLDSLLGLAAAPPPATTEIYRGTNKETMSFLSEEPPMTRITARPVRPGFVPAPSSPQPAGNGPVTRPAGAPTEPPTTKPASGPTDIPSPAAEPQAP